MVTSLSVEREISEKKDHEPVMLFSIINLRCMCWRAGELNRV